MNLLEVHREESTSNEAERRHKWMIEGGFLREAALES